MWSFPGAFTDAAGGQGEDDWHGSKGGEERRLSGSLQWPERVSLSAGGEGHIHI